MTMDMERLKTVIAEAEPETLGEIYWQSRCFQAEAHNLVLRRQLETPGFLRRLVRRLWPLKQIPS